MEKAKLEYYKKIIMQKREELLKNLDQMKASGLNSSVREETGDHSSYSFHMADQGTDTMEREQQYMFASRENNYLYHLEQALERIEEGDFGTCVSCGLEISPERLEVVPHARMCIKCKSNEESSKR